MTEFTFGVRIKFSDEFIGLKKEINAETWSNGLYFTKVNTSNAVL